MYSKREEYALKGSKFFSFRVDPFNPFNHEFMKWTFPSLKLDMSIVANKGVSKKHNRMADNVDPDKMAHSWFIQSL